MYTVKSVVIILRSFSNAMYPLKSSAITSLLCVAKLNFVGWNFLQCFLLILIWVLLIVRTKVYLGENSSVSSKNQVEGKQAILPMLENPNNFVSNEKSRAAFEICLVSDFSAWDVPFAWPRVPSPASPAKQSGLRLPFLLILTLLQQGLLLKKGPVALSCPDLTFLLPPSRQQ